jgi:two-component system OmpR family response regulator
MKPSNHDNMPKKILLIEDEGDICFLLNIILKGKEIDVDHVNTLAQAKVILRDQAPDLVFLDNSLPDGRGTDFIEYIKVNHPNTKIILITGYGSPMEKERAIYNGANLFLEKPFTKSQIYSAVTGLLEIKNNLAA